MKLFSKLFKNNDSTTNIVQENMSLESPMCQSLRSIKFYMEDLLSQNRYIAKSEFKSRLSDEIKTIEHFNMLKRERLIDIFCKYNSISITVVEDTLSKFMNFEALVDEHNEAFVCRTLKDKQTYLDNILLEMRM